MEYEPELYQFEHSGNITIKRRLFPEVYKIENEGKTHYVKYWGVDARYTKTFIGLKPKFFYAIVFYFQSLRFKDYQKPVK